MIKAYWLKIFILLCFLTGFTACSLEAGKKGSDTMTAKTNTQLLGKLLQHPEFESYLHPEAEGRKPVIIKVNDLALVSGEIEKFGQPVVFTTDKPSVEAYLEVDQIKHIDETIQFKVRYDVEGVVVVGRYLNDEDGTFKDINIIEN